MPTARFSPCWVKAFILPLKDFASLPKLAFPIEDFDVGGVLEGQVKGGRVGGGEGWGRVGLSMVQPSYRIRADHTLNGHIDAAA